ncbi:L-serine dehydratase [Actinomyces capricornis]|uniref:L-serine ammonia-lyase n=2 Tax=Actinomyces capricornis TaxID=2755559 RepID=A0ABM7U9Y7_9ACTO|nr:L-serine dehydratase [Actinomyces capricornis]
MTIRDIAVEPPTAGSATPPSREPDRTGPGAVSSAVGIAVEAEEALVPTALEETTPAALMAGALPAERAPRPLSVFDLMRIGIGPSSSHTVGPMRASRAYATALAQALAAVGPGHGGATAPAVSRLTVELYGSLGATGRGHATDRAVLMGLAGHEPESVPAEVCASHMEQVGAAEELVIHGVGPVPFTPAADIHFLPGRVLPYHVNGMTLTAYRPDGGEILRRTYYSVGGGFVMEDVGTPGAPSIQALSSASTTQVHATPAPYPFTTSAALLEICRREELGVADVVLANEISARPRHEVIAYLDRLRSTMRACIEAGIHAEGTLPGGLGVRRRAKALHERLQAQAVGPGKAFAMADPLRGMDWVDLFALAVNEENAAGRRVVTAPTNGAAGIVPAVLAYYERFIPGADDDGARRFLLAATAVGGLIKTNASIAGAEVGCQGEVGSASSMAAAGLAEALGGSPAQVENAAEIAMEHNLGLTCDPVGGLVQIPCIERNAVAAVKAINAARMALWGEGRHAVSLDTVIETMRQTGEDMLAKYKETSRGGLAVNVIEC